jgi:mevalonate kinase
MLFGEHAVLKGYPAIVCALKPRLRVYAKAREDGRLHVCAMGLEREMLWIERTALASDFRFLAACIDTFEAASCGLDIVVESSLSSTKGFGSSAALIASALGAITLALEARSKESVQPVLDKTKEAFLMKGIALLRKVQGFGSGADLAASLYGGCLEYSYSHMPKPMEPYGPLYLVYSGYKTPTSEVLKQLHDKQQAGTLDHAAIDELGQVCLAALAMWTSMDKMEIQSRLCHRHQQAMRRLKLVDQRLDELCKQLDQQGIVHKISGSGLGDSVLCFQKPELDPGRITEVEIDDKGLRFGYGM